MQDIIIGQKVGRKCLQAEDIESKYWDDEIKSGL